MIPEDLLLQSLKQKDRQIANLSQSLQARDKRIRELELALLKSVDRPLNGSSDMPVWTEMPVAAAVHNGVDPSAQPENDHPVPKLHALLRMDSSSGICIDSWIEAKSVLALREEVAGHNLQLDLYLPENASASAKPLTVASNFGESQRLMLNRSEVTPCSIHVPSGSASQLYLEFETPAEPKNGSDLRHLGVVILDARLA